MTRKLDQDRPSYDLLMAIREGQKLDMLYGEQNNLIQGRKHAKLASQNLQASLRGLKKMEGL